MMLETSILSTAAPQRGVEALAPGIKIVEEGQTHGSFSFEPLDRGYGISIGNPLRRMLLSSIEGTAITWVKIDGVLHEYSTIPHMKEEVMEFLMNVKGVRIRSVTGRPGKMRLEIRGEGRVCAGDVATSADFEVVNPEHHLATLDSEEAILSVEFNVDHGKGYQPVTQGDGLAGPLMGVLPVDAIFNPVRKVSYHVERTRVGHVTDYERLILEVWTDGTVTPVEALRKSSQELVDHFFKFSNLGTEERSGPERPSVTVSPEIYQTPIEKLELSPRTLNCLKRAHITKVGNVLEMTNSELLKIRNFGEKSLRELMDKLKTESMLSDDEWSSRMFGYADGKDAGDGAEIPPPEGDDEIAGGAQDVALEEGRDEAPSEPFGLEGVGGSPQSQMDHSVSVAAAEEELAQVTDGDPAGDADEGEGAETSESEAEGEPQLAQEEDGVEG